MAVLIVLTHNHHHHYHYHHSIGGGDGDGSGGGSSDDDGSGDGGDGSSSTSNRLGHSNGTFGDYRSRALLQVVCRCCWRNSGVKNWLCNILNSLDSNIAAARVGALMQSVGGRKSILSPRFIGRLAGNLG